jgi:hypothetical protein
MLIPGKSVDQTCNGEACCHQGLSMTENEAFEVGISSSRADFKTLIGNADAATRHLDWTGLVY